MSHRYPRKGVPPPHAPDTNLRRSVGSLGRLSGKGGRASPSPVVGQVCRGRRAPTGRSPTEPASRCDTLGSARMGDRPITGPAPVATPIQTFPRQGARLSGVCPIALAAPESMRAAAGRRGGERRSLHSGTAVCRLFSPLPPPWGPRPPRPPPPCAAPRAFPEA